jgi:hypothetical protein
MATQKFIPESGFELLAEAIADFVAARIGEQVHLTMEIVTTLPATGADNVIYLVVIAGRPSSYTMHAYISGAWRDMGVTDIDLANYWSKTDLRAMTAAEMEAILNDVFS